MPDTIGTSQAEATVPQQEPHLPEALGARRIAGLAESLDVAPSTAGRMCDRLVRKGLVRRHRARGDRRVVLVSITPAGRRVVDEATGRRRALIEEILGRLSPAAQRAVAEAFREFTDAAGEVPDSQWPAAAAAAREPEQGQRTLVHPDGQGRPAPPSQGIVNMKERA